MKTTKFTPTQIVNILKQNEAGILVQDLCRNNGISRSTFYAWRTKYGNTTVPMVERIKELEIENSRLKRMYANERLKLEIATEVITKKL